MTRASVALDGGSKGGASRRALLLLLAALPLAGGLARGASGQAITPDASASPAKSVVLVTIDTLRADALGAYGSPTGATPNLDRLSREGVLFEQAHTTQPNTLPSHASILTGRWPHRHGVRSNAGYALLPDQVTLAERLADAGYATAAEIAAPVLGRSTGILQGFASYRDTDSPDVALQQVTVGKPPGRLKPGTVVRSDTGPVPLGTRDAADITRRGIEFLKSRRGEPFFLWLHYFDPHYPYVPPPRHRKLLGELYPYVWPYEPQKPLLWEVRKRLYAGEVAYVDEQIGRLVAALEAEELADTTLLVVTSDHGEGLGEHGEESHSYFVHQTTMRIPLIFWGPPELPRGRRIADAVGSVDVAPTVLGWLGQEPFASADGTSLLPFGGVAPQRAYYGESIELHRVFDAPVLRFLREGRWKYVHKPRPALFDLDADPSETRDLARTRAQEAKRLAGRLRALLGAGAPAPDARTEIDPERAAQLAALGYVADARAGPAPERLDSLDVAGADPSDLVEDVDRMTRVGGDVPIRGREGDLLVLRDLAARYPDSLPILEKLLAAQLDLGRGKEGLVTLRRIVDLDPDDRVSRVSLGELLMKLGESDQARDALIELLGRFPCENTSRSHLANLYAGASEHAARIALLEEGIARCDAPPDLLNDLAYALATIPDDALRDGDRALALARRAVPALDEHPFALDTLAAAQAEAGRLSEARATARRAVRRAREMGLPEDVVGVLAGHAAELEAGRPIRD